MKKPTQTHLNQFFKSRTACATQTKPQPKPLGSIRSKPNMKPKLNKPKPKPNQRKAGLLNKNSIINYLKIESLPVVNLLGQTDHSKCDTTDISPPLASVTVEP